MVGNLYKNRLRVKYFSVRSWHKADLRQAKSAMSEKRTFLIELLGILLTMQCVDQLGKETLILQNDILNLEAWIYT